MADTFTHVSLKPSKEFRTFKELHVNFRVAVDDKLAPMPVTAVFADVPQTVQATMTPLAIFVCGHLLGFLPHWLDGNLPRHAVNTSMLELRAAIGHEFAGWNLFEVRLWRIPLKTEGFEALLAERAKARRLHTEND